MIGQVSSQERGQVDPEGVKRGQPKRGLLPQTQCSGLTIVPTRTGSGTRGKRSLDKVGEDHGGPVVGESLAEFDECDEVRGEGDSVGDSAEGVHLFFRGVDIVGVCSCDVNLSAMFFPYVM